MTTRLLDALTWKRYSLGGGSAEGDLGLSIGTVGSGGPVALIAAGVHGDEGPWGAWAIRKLLDTTSSDELKGTLRVIPMANPLAMQADKRNAPLDTLDLNRVFPGNADGSHTERLAAIIAEHGIEGVDVAIDLHGGGSWCVNSFTFASEGGEHITRAFDAPFTVSMPERTVTLSGYARSKGAAVAGIEMGGRSELEDKWATRIAEGLRRALGVTGVLTPSSLPEAKPSLPVKPSKVLRPSTGGIFIPEVRADAVGTIGPGGTTLGYLLDPVTQQIIETFEAPFERTAIMLLRPTIAQVEVGAMTYVVSEPT
jgi:predicted deacylase